MKRLCVFVGLSFIVTSANAAFIESFDEGINGWNFSTVKNNGQVKSYSPDWHAGGGNSGGYITAPIDTHGNRRLYGMEPSDVSVFGDLTGLQLTVDTMLQGLVEGPGDMSSVRFYVGTRSQGEYNYYVSNDAYSWNPNSDIEWTTHQVEMISDNFVLWPNQAARTKSFEEVIASVEDIGLVFTDSIGHFTSNRYLGFTGSHDASLAIDNFGATGLINQNDGAMVPEPSAVVILLLGAVPLMARLKRKSLS